MRVGCSRAPSTYSTIVEGADHLVVAVPLPATTTSSDPSSSHSSGSTPLSGSAFRGYRQAEAQPDRAHQCQQGNACTCFVPSDSYVCLLVVGMSVCERRSPSPGEARRAFPPFPRARDRRYESWGISPTRRRAGQRDRRGMTTSSTNEVRHWSDFLRFLAPGPIALGISACVNPAVWQAMGARRHAGQPQARDEGPARRTAR